METPLWQITNKEKTNTQKYHIDAVRRIKHVIVELIFVATLPPAFLRQTDKHPQTQK